MSKKSNIVNEIKLVSISTLKGAEYNPRIRVPERFEKLISSLRHLGFILPLYATTDGVLLSGHQRTAAARELGYTMVPVVFMDVSEMTDTKVKGLNVYFNRATNDFDGFDLTKDRFSELLALEEAIDYSKLPVIAPDTVYPCMTVTYDPIDPYFSNVEPPSTTARNGAANLLGAGVNMPLVACGTRVVNGTSRVYCVKRAGYDEMPVVQVPPEAADYAKWVLNCISMDFNIQEAYADELRFNAYRRLSVQNTVIGLSRTYSYFPFGRIVKNSGVRDFNGENARGDLMLLPHLCEDTKSKYLKTYGDTIIDFGAGTLHDANLMAEGGFNMVAFEPYRCLPGEATVHPGYSRDMNSQFLDDLRVIFEKRKERSIISSYVLNSIPHHKDRMAYLTILAAMATPQTTVFVGTQYSAGAIRVGHISPNMEANMTLGDSMSSFKAQKYFHIDELKKMLSVFFLRVHVDMASNTIFARCQYPKRPNARLLKEALELEFDLPYADGTRMGLVEKAKEVFSSGLGLKFE